MALDTPDKVIQARTLADRLIQKGKQQDLNEQERQTLTQLAIGIREAELRFGLAGRGDPTGGASQAAAGALAQPGAAPVAANPIPNPTGAVIQPGAIQSGGEGVLGQFLERVQQVGDLAQRFVLDDESFEARAGERLQARAVREIGEETRAIESGVGTGPLKAGRVIGDLAPDVAAFGFLGGARTATGRIAGEVTFGAVDAATRNSLSDGETLALNTMLASGLGGGVGLLFEAPGKAKQFLLAKAQSAAKSPVTQANVRQAQEAGIDVTLSEASQRSDIKAIEREIPVGPESKRGQFLEKRRVQIRDKFDRIEQGLNPNNLSPEQVIRGTRGAYATVIDDLQANASLAFRTELTPAAEALGASIDDAGRIIGGDPVISTDSLRREYAEQIALAGDNNVREATINRMQDELDRIPETMTLGQLQKRLSDMSKDAFGSGRVLADNASAADRLDDGLLLDALLADVSDAAREGAPGAAALQSARRNYAAAKAEIKAFKETKLDALLGKVGDPSAEDFAQRILKLPSKDFSDLMRIADDAQPGLANAIRGRVFGEMVNKHGIVRAAGGTDQQFQVDVGRFLGEFRGNQRRYEALMSMDTKAKFATEELRDAHRALGVLEMIAKGPNLSEEAVAEGFSSRLQGMVINAVSQNPAFASRFIAGELGPGWLEKVMFSDEGIRALAQMGQVGRKRVAVNGAITTFVNMMTESDAEIKEARDAARIQEIRRQDRIIEEGQR